MIKQKVFHALPSGNISKDWPDVLEAEIIFLAFERDMWTRFSHVRSSPFDSSVGRAVDCRWRTTVIHRSLVQIRLEG